MTEPTTTFAWIAAQREAGNYAEGYSTWPKVDVPVLPKQTLCESCDEPVFFNREADYFGRWEHVSADAEKHYVAPQRTCMYCHAIEGVTFRQHPWYDAIECSRCKGVQGWAIGD